MVSVTGYPRGGAPGPGRSFVTRATRNQREIWYMESGPSRVNAPLEGPVIFGLWGVRFPLVLVRTGRRLPVQALCERGVLVAVTGYPRDGAPGPVLYQGYQKSKRNLVYGIWSQ